MPRVSTLCMYSAKMHTLSSITFGLNRYTLPFSAVNSAIAQPLLFTFAPLADIALFVSFAVSTMSGLTVYAPIVSDRCFTSLTTSPTSA